MRFTRVDHFIELPPHSDVACLAWGSQKDFSRLSCCRADREHSTRSWVNRLYLACVLLSTLISLSLLLPLLLPNLSLVEGSTHVARNVVSFRIQDLNQFAEVNLRSQLRCAVSLFYLYLFSIFISFLSLSPLYFHLFSIAFLCRVVLLFL